MNNEGNVPLNSSGPTSGPRGESDAMKSSHVGDTMGQSNMDPNIESRTAAEALRDSTYGHSKSGTHTQESYGSRSAHSDSYSQDTTSKLGGHSFGTRSTHIDNTTIPGGVAGLGSRGFDDPTINPTTNHHYGQGTTTGNYIPAPPADRDLGDPSRAFAIKTGVNSGKGVHAQQYERGTGALEGGGTTAVVTEGVGHHRSPLASGHHAPSEHVHPTGLSTSKAGTGETMMTTSTDKSITEGPSDKNLRPGEVVVEHITKVHKGGMAYGSGQHPSTTGVAGTGALGTSTAGTTGASTRATSGVSSAQKPASGFGSTGNKTQSLGEHAHGKPTITDKIVGGVETFTGKMTSNPAKVEHGLERAAGEFEPVKKLN